MWIYAGAVFTIFLGGKKAERCGCLRLLLFLCRMHFAVGPKGGLHHKAVTNKSHFLNVPRRNHEKENVLGRVKTGVQNELNSYQDILRSEPSGIMSPDVWSPLIPEAATLPCELPRNAISCPTHNTLQN